MLYSMIRFYDSMILISVVFLTKYPPN